MALSRGSPRVAVSNHPALWSPDLPRLYGRRTAAQTRPSGRLVRRAGHVLRGLGSTDGADDLGSAGLRITEVDMPQPTGAELDEIRAHRDQLRAKYLTAASQRPTTTARGVHHAAFICRDVEETIRFYQDFLGFPLVELVENRDYAGSSHFFFDIGNRNLLGFFDFPGHDHPPFAETIGALQHLAISVSRESVHRGQAEARRRRHRLPRSGPGCGRQPVLPRPERSGFELYHDDPACSRGPAVVRDGAYEGACRQPCLSRFGALVLRRSEHGALRAAARDRPSRRLSRPIAPTPSTPSTGRVWSAVITRRDHGSRSTGESGRAASDQPRDGWCR